MSKKPPAWFKYAPEEVEALIAKLAKEGNSPSSIGAILRDKYGVPLVKPVAGKSITELVRASGQTPKVPEDLDNLFRRAGALRKHLEKNRKDYHNKRALATVESKIHRLVKYYKAEGRLQPEWEYKPMAASVA
ncbi:30S ribosomal protein S15 [Candidatus Bathyarchaeota archaeon]|nr:30S ribosomal protein S15 [Candidatus Bathyarchaeota archaeon]